jgi:ribonuclease HII
MKKKILPPSFNEEKLLWNSGFKTIIGIDEVGRGAFAGPLVVAAVVFSPCFCLLKQLCSRCDNNFLREIHDSKLLSATKREILSTFIKSSAFAWSIAEIPVVTINKVGIGKALHIAYRKVVSSILYQVVSMKSQKTDKEIRRNTGYLILNTDGFILMDGFPIQHFSKKRQKAIIKGDQKSISIAAASIIAKVYRDRLMQQLPEKYSMYQFEKHKGYGTQQHREAIRQYGLSPLHRTSFDLAKFTISS